MPSTTRWRRSLEAQAAVVGQDPLAAKEQFVERVRGDSDSTVAAIAFAGREYELVADRETRLHSQLASPDLASGRVKQDRN